MLVEPGHILVPRSALGVMAAETAASPLDLLVVAVAVGLEQVPVGVPLIQGVQEWIHLVPVCRIGLGLILIRVSTPRMVGRGTESSWGAGVVLVVLLTTLMLVTR
jgi:hypothetical protein